MRDIKFRAWDGRRTMVPACGVVDGYFQLQAGRNYGGFEQFTGLHDKNGKEIYEGDIVKYIGGQIESGTAVIVPLFGTANMAFEWIEQKTKSPSIYTSIEYMGCKDELEIIGNIHQNPELLEELV